MRSITNKRICESCGTIDGGGTGQKLLECAGCLSSYFCNTQCQQQSWPLHKKVCRQRKKSVVKIQSNWRGWYTRRQLVINDGQDRCEVCGVLDGKDKQLNICDGCKLSLFCSVRCQEYAWKKKNHKIICQERQKAVLKIQSVWRASIRERYEDDRERYDDDNVSVKNDKDSNTNIGEEEVLDADELKDELKERIMRVDSYVPLSIRKNAGLSTPETIRCLIMSGDTLIDTALMIFIICIVSRNQFLVRISRLKFIFTSPI